MLPAVPRWGQQSRGAGSGPRDPAPHSGNIGGGCGCLEVALPLAVAGGLSRQQRAGPRGVRPRTSCSWSPDPAAARQEAPLGPGPRAEGPVLVADLEWPRCYRWAQEGNLGLQKGADLGPRPRVRSRRQEGREEWRTRQSWAGKPRARLPGLSPLQPRLPANLPGKAMSRGLLLPGDALGHQDDSPGYGMLPWCRGSHQPH